MVKRQLPRARELAPLLRFAAPRLPSTQRRLQRALTIYDLRRIAARRTPRAAFDYTEGAAEDELSLARARQAFRDVEFHPSILRDVSRVDTGWDVLGRRVELPFGIAPTGFTRLMHTAGETAGATAAAAAGIPFALSTMGTTTIEDVAKAGAPIGRSWFQLYIWKDRDRSMALGRAGRRGRIRHVAGHRRRAGGRRPVARQAQRLLDPAGAHRGHRGQRDHSPGLVARPVHHRAADVRVAVGLGLDAVPN